MIWDFLVGVGNRHPVVMRGIVGTIAFVVFGYVGLAAISSGIVEGNREACERGNAGRLADLREAQALETAAANEKGQAHTIVGREVAEEKMKIYETKQTALIAVAAISGHATTEGAVTINCTDEWPRPLPWLGD